MAKHRNRVKAEEPLETESNSRRSSSATSQAVSTVTIAALAALLAFSYFNGRSTRESETNLTARLDQIDSRLEKLSGKLEQAARNTAPQRGPDPNRVYPVKIDGSPVEGPLTAAVTIAEFSDFQ
jgi:protein-disulfide isomerase